MCSRMKPQAELESLRALARQRGLEVRDEWTAAQLRVVLATGGRMDAAPSAKVARMG